MLLIYISFSGVASVLLYPSPLPTLFKDIFFIIPTYLSFFLIKQVSVSQFRIPKSIIRVLMALIAIVFVQMFNPNVSNWMVAAIGAKVWLFYIPLMFVGYALLRSGRDWLRFLRIVVTVGWIPCTIGILEWSASLIFGYSAAMDRIYGQYAATATQNYANFDIGSAFLFRIPSTFAFVTQYFGYTLVMIVAAYALIRTEVSTWRRRFGSVSFGLFALAAFMSGARAAFLFVPILIVTMYLIDPIGGHRISRIIVLFVLSLSMFVYFTGIAITPMYTLVFGLTEQYGRDIALGGIGQALSEAPLGLGTGMNTGAARYAFTDPNSFLAIENYYAKAIYELGVVGFILVLALFLLIIAHGFKVKRSLVSKSYGGSTAALVAFFVIISLNSFKGWQIDLDPINVYFWLFVGFMFKLKYLDLQEYAWLPNPGLVNRKVLS